MKLEVITPTITNATPTPWIHDTVSPKNSRPQSIAAIG